MFRIVFNLKFLRCDKCLLDVSVVTCKKHLFLNIAMLIL